MPEAGISKEKRKARMLSSEPSGEEVKEETVEEPGGGSSVEGGRKGANWTGEVRTN